jgi:uncharacterized protein with PIN domain
MRFLLDGMLGKLTRWLRMLGHEAVYENDRPDDKLLAIAKDRSLTLLTSDEELYRTATFRGIDAFQIQGKNEPERLAELAKRYRLRLDIDANKSRCPTCGFLIKQTPKDTVKESVPSATLKVYKDFWVCTNPDCSKVYWQGSHWKKIDQTLQAAKKILEANSNPSKD